MPYRALGARKRYLIGVRNLLSEVDARYIKGMIANPACILELGINRGLLAKS